MTMVKFTIEGFWTLALKNIFIVPLWAVVDPSVIDLVARIVCRIYGYDHNCGIYLIPLHSTLTLFDSI